MILIPRKYSGHYDLHVSEHTQTISFTVRGIDPENDKEEQLKTSYISKEEAKVLCQSLLILLND